MYTLQVAMIIIWLHSGSFFVVVRLVSGTLSHLTSTEFCTFALYNRDSSTL